MALNSPGVEVTVIDESFYTPAASGTVPLVVVATAENKTNAAGTGMAAGTLASNFGTVYKVTSQKELVDTFGVPFFEKTPSNTPIHGSELNEYGLLAAYSLLGVSNAAFIVRANVDLGQLEGQVDAPGANPSNGTWWVDTANTTWGIQEWNAAPVSEVGGQKFAAKSPIVLTDDDVLKIESDGDTNYGRKPKVSVGSIGDYAITFETVSNEYARLWYKSVGNIQAGVQPGQWVLVGSSAWKASHPTIKGDTDKLPTAGDTFVINGPLPGISGTTITVPAAATVGSVVDQINGNNISGVTAKLVNGSLWIYSDGNTNVTGGGITIAAGSGTVLDDLGIAAGTYNPPAIWQEPHTNVPQWKSTVSSARPTGSVWVKTTEPTNGARWRVKKWSSATTSWESVEAYIYKNTHEAIYNLDRSGGGTGIAVDSIFVQTNADEYGYGNSDNPEVSEFRVWRRKAVGETVITSGVVTDSTFGAGTHIFQIAESKVGQKLLDSFVEISANTIATTGTPNEARDANLNSIAGAINAAGFTNIEARITSNYEIQIVHKAGGDFRFFDVTGDIITGDESPTSVLFTPFNISNGTGTANLYALSAGAEDSSGQAQHLATNWEPLAVSDFYASNDAPENTPDDGTLWYNPDFSDVDIMIHDGTKWVGYRNAASPYSETVSTARRTTGFLPIVSASNPYNSETITGDIWISTADIENYPTIYRYDAALTGVRDESERWIQIDKTDQVTEDGILFADARYGTSGANGDVAGDLYDLADSNYQDPDAPDPALYPRGMLLWNTRRSGGNVKRYVSNYIDTTTDNPRFGPSPTFVDESMADYAVDRWVTASPNAEDGSGQFGRKAQRSVVVQAMKSIVDTSDQARDEERRNFNLIAAPGYPELLSNLVNLNIDRGITAFVVGDTPFRLPADATSLLTWGTNANLVFDNGDDGIVTYDEYCAVFYPNGFTTDLGGSNAVVPASHMMLRTIALSDNVSYPWFAPAGTRRGGITNATAVGYIDSLSGEFQTVALNEGQRDTLYDLKVNPITFFNGVGLVNYGQKTRARNASALDRINVARLVVYLRTQLNRLARPYIFEPNDKITRDEIKQACDSLLLELVGLRALYDFAVVCDESNNTPSRIDRNELYVDIAIEPVKAVEFIYIPLRVKNTGEI